MLRDVFYFGSKPNAHPREQQALNLADARAKATTRDFWIINEFCDYRNFDWDFDFEFLPDEDVWAEDHNNVWPSQHQKDSGTWLCAKEFSDIIIYRGDVDPIERKNEKSDNWVLLDLIDESKFDFSWHPDPSDPPYIYKWGCKFFPAQFKHVLEYRVPNATEVKYMDTIAELLPNEDCWLEIQTVDRNHFDMSWRPNPLDPPYIYVWGNKWIDGKLKSTLEYHMPGATDKKYMPELVPVLPQWDNWVEVQEVDKAKFDFSWRPDPREPAYIYTWGNEYIEAELRPTLEYHCEGATERKYMTNDVPVLPEWNKWDIPKNVNTDGFNFSWRPDPREPDLIYEFATQWQKTGGPRYIIEGATETKYVDFQKVKRLPSNEGWTIPSYIDRTRFDFSWHPDATSPPYTYVFATQWAFSGGPVYTVDGATEIKYVEDQIATALPNKENWDYDPTIIDEDSIDFSWHPYVEDQPYIYQFGTQWQKTGGPRYIAPGATVDSPVKYIDTRIVKSKRLPCYDNWHFLIEGYELAEFDHSWHPDDTEEPYIYVFGNTYYPAEEMPTMEYRVPGATQKKYIHDTYAKLAPNKTNWIIPDDIDESSFDFGWLPHPEDPPYIYEFATQWQKTGGPKYIVEGAKDVKYLNIVKAKHLPSMKNWIIPDNITIEDFDFSWHPDATSPAYVYYFPTQWALSGGPIYKAPGAVEVRYEEFPVATVASNKENWEYDPTLIDADSFDFSWHPYADDQPYIYQFGTQWQKTGGPRYIATGADEMSPIKYIDTRVLKAKRLPNPKNFTIVDGIKIKEFDFSWHPDETEEPYIYVFGNNQYSAEEMPTIEYRVNGATNTKYITSVKATLGINLTHWEIPDDVDVANFDFSWVPHPKSPPYIYQFGTLADNKAGPKYVVPGNDGEVVYLERVETKATDQFSIGQYIIKTSLEDLINERPNEVFWAIRSNIDYTNFDFTWRPNLRDLEYVQVFGSPESELTQTYFVNASQYLSGNTSFKFIEDIKLDDQTLSKIFVKPDMFYVDRGNAESNARFEVLKAKYNTRIQKTRYLNSWVDTIKRCTNRATSELIWVLNSELDYSDFDFDYYPNPWQMKMVHVFGTQWSHWGTTFLVNRETFAEDTKYINVIEHLSNLNFVKTIRAKATECVYDVVLVDHGNNETENVLAQIKSKAGTKNVSVVKYNNSYLETIRDIVKKQQDKKENYLWICSSVCDYNNVDLSYICDPFAKDQLHVFPSGTQKFGDTFFIDVNKTKEVIADIESLNDYHKINFNGSLRAKRLPEPLIVTNEDTHVNSIKHVSDFPYITVVTADNVDIQPVDVEPMSLWSSETKNIISTSTGASRIVIPKEAQDYVKKELYDYPYIKRAPKLAMSNPLDIVFLSNGESKADEHWEHLLNVTKGLKNRVVRVDGIDGRAKAYHAAAEASNTAWMFTVFAKLKVSPKFDWNWQPDRMQSPKHYIFHAKNPVNGLTYGHQAMIAYNKKLTLSNEGRGLDFTLDDEHETVPLISGTAHYNTDPFSTWRTAFREVIKLRADATEDSRVRLDAWLNKAEGDFAQYSIKGAVDADEYFDEVHGDFNMLKLSYEWAWLRDRFENL